MSALENESPVGRGLSRRIVADMQDKWSSDAKWTARWVRGRINKDEMVEALMGLVGEKDLADLNLGIVGYVGGALNQLGKLLGHPFLGAMDRVVNDLSGRLACLDREVVKGHIEEVFDFIADMTWERTYACEHIACGARGDSALLA